MKKQIFNPYLPSYEYVPDGEPHVFLDEDGSKRLYVFGSHDGFGDDEFCLNDYVCWSAPVDDLSDWRYEGVIYKKTQDKDNASGKSHMNAPDVCRGLDGRYYLYYKLHDKMYTSVAVAERPAGPYEYYGVVHHKNGKKYCSKKGDSYNFDPGMLVDDGHVYMYTGFAPNAEFPWIFRFFMKFGGASFKGGCCVELEPDMITVKSDTYQLIPGEKEAAGTSFEGHGFFEASSPRKINEKYYLIYSSSLSHELCYATSDSPVGGFEYGGTIISIGDVGLSGITTKEQARNYTGNTHGGLVEINGQWYIFYHRQTNLKKCNRQGCAEKIFFKEDGSIPQVEITSCGLNDGPLMGVGKYEARVACNLFDNEDSFSYDAYMNKNISTHPYFTQTGEDREYDGDQYIANMRDGAVAGFKYFDFKEYHPANITVEMKGKAKGKFIVALDESLSKVAAEIPVEIDSKDYMSIRAEISLPDEVCPLFFKFTGDGAVDFFSFELS